MIWQKIYNSERIIFQPSLINDFRLNELQWSEVLGGPYPEFPKTPMLKRPAGSGAASSSQAQTPNGVDKPAKKQSAKQQQTPGSTAASPTSSGKKKKQPSKSEKAKQQKDEKTRKAVGRFCFRFVYSMFVVIVATWWYD